jgi:hypothetical protein
MLFPIILILSFGAFSLGWSITPDVRFGLVGSGGATFAAKFGLSYYTLEGNYSADRGGLFSSVDPVNDPAPGFKVVREVAKLNVRTDGLGETNAQFQTKLAQYTKELASWYLMPAWGRGKKPVFKWYVPDALALIHAESLQIVETIRREKARNPQITGTIWEIGNEPNFFPAILPTEYAAIFSQYSRVIKAEDPAAVIAMGALFMPEINQDLKLRFGEELEAKMKMELEIAGLYNTMVSLDLFQSLVADVKNTVLSRTLALSTQEYLRQVLDATAARPDLVSVHAYPYDDRAPFLDSAAMQNILDTTATGISTVLALKGISDTWGDRGSIWITEFGNIEQGLDANQVAERMRLMLSWFQGNPAYGHWFHYKSIGVDDQFALFSSGPAPLTRLVTESTFIPVDGNFACSHLNAVGHTYWRASHGGQSCQDPVVVIPVPLPDEVPEDNPDTLLKTPVAINDSLPNQPLTPRLPPVIVNAEGSAISPLIPLQWSWEPGLASSNAFSLVELFQDTLATQPLFRNDSLKVSSLTVALPSGTKTVWPRVKIWDTEKNETPWSAWKKLSWVPTSPTRILAGPAVGFSVKMVAGGRSFLILRINLPVAASIKVEILDSRGQARRMLFQGHLAAGSHAFPYDGRGERGRKLQPGIYFCRFQANGEARTIPSSILP